MEAVLLSRIVKHTAKDAGTAPAVACAEARRLCCLALMVVDQLHARELFSGALSGGMDEDLTPHILALRDPFGTTIAGELLAWRDAHRQLVAARFVEPLQNILTHRRDYAARSSGAAAG